MLANVSERKMLGVRGFLFVAWLVLIASLVWDPYSDVLTAPDQISSPFRTDGETIVVQNREIGSDPYPMGARIFWTMAVPLLPLFLMVFGHEAWRRICPLSFASQLPGYLGLRRRRARLDRRTGMLDRALVLIGRDTWVARNVWYVQFGFLFAGITARLLLINSDRTAMALALAGVIVAAMLTGVLWGGKTWCNYFCPANIVQKIYTEPRGLLESAPHLTRPTIPQSMCRTPTPKGDRSACVACTANCGDIDLERSYWQGILNPQRRNTYYMFLGLILGFYGYYYLYAGSWDYYFSGIWTHEAGLRQRMLGPGLYIAGQPLPIPKLIAAPLTLAIACALSLLVGRMLERLYRRFRAGQRDFSEAVIVNHCLSVTAWLSINAFYLFGGRPNLLLLPNAGLRVVDVLIIALTTLWLRQALQSSPGKYERESMASRLLGQLRQMKVNVSRALDGRSIDDLKPDEIYVLSKVLPSVSHEQKLVAYRNVLSQAVAEGGTASASTLRLLEEMRVQLEISDDEHTTSLEELGVSQEFEMAGIAVPEAERKAALDGYRDLLGNLVAGRVGPDCSIDDILADAEIQSMIQVLRASLHIQEGDHLAVLAGLADNDGILSNLMRETLDQVVNQQALRFAIEALDIRDPLGTALVGLLTEELRKRENTLCARGLSLLQVFGVSDVGREHAQGLSAVGSAGLPGLLSARIEGRARWCDILEPEIVEILSGPGRVPRDVPPQWSHRRVLAASMDTPANMVRLMDDDDPLLRAIGLTVFAMADPALAARHATLAVNDPRSSEHPFLRDVVNRLADAETSDPAATDTAGLQLGVDTGNGYNEVTLAGRDCLTIGRSPDNDLVLDDASIWAYHAAIRIQNQEVRALKLDGGPLFVDGRPVTSETPALEPGAQLTFAPGDKARPVVLLDWDANALGGDRLVALPIMRIAMLACNPQLRQLPLARLAQLAQESRGRRMGAHAKVTAPDNRPTSFLVHFGTVRLFDPARMRFRDAPQFGPGDIVDAELCHPQATLMAETGGDFALLLQLPPAPEIAAAARANHEPANTPALPFADAVMIEG